MTPRSTAHPSLALLFDMDGVIIDSMPLHTQAWEQHLIRHGLHPDAARNRMQGKRNDELVRDLFGQHLDDETVSNHSAEKEALFRELMRHRIDEFMISGVIDFIRRHAGNPLAVGSNAEPANIDFVLRGSGLLDAFDHVVDGHQVERPKPHPDMYLKAASLLNTPPADCIVFEDSPTGLAAARAAGTRVVAINSAGLADLGGPVDLEIPHFSDPRLDSWLLTQLPGTR
jgi:beta-phosphoglucomutase